MVSALLLKLCYYAAKNASILEANSSKNLAVGLYNLRVTMFAV